MAFVYEDNKLFIEKVSVADIVKITDTPVYCYSLQTIIDNLALYKRIPNSLICFAAKANPNLSILHAIANAGGGADVVSEGEIRHALAAGIPTNKIVFSGTGKTSAEILFAIDKNIHQINAESLEEIKLINEIAGKLKKNVRVAIRLNPDIDAMTHDKNTTGLSINKFGMQLRSVEQLNTKDYSNIDFVGVSCHIGSGIKKLSIFQVVVNYIKNAVSILENLGWQIQSVDVGGGLGISYSHHDSFPSIQEYVNFMIENFADYPYKIICEPGRSIVANCGILVTRILFKKFNDFKTHVIVDAGMNDLIRPAMYGECHQVIPINRNDKLPKMKVDIVGPICETGDTFAKEYLIQELNCGDLLAICDAGAYCMSQSNNYNCRLIAPEVLVRNKKLAIVRDRENYENLLKKTRIVDDIFM